MAVAGTIRTRMSAPAELVLPPGTDLVLGAGKEPRRLSTCFDRGNFGKTIACDHGRCDFSKLKAPPAFLTFDASALPVSGASASGNLDFKPQPGLKTRHLHGTPVYWVSAAHGPMLFAWGENAELRAFSMDPSGRINRPMFPDQVGKIGGVHARLGAFANRRQSDDFDEIAALIQNAACAIEGGDRWREWSCVGPPPGHSRLSGHTHRAHRRLGDTGRA